MFGEEDEAPQCGRHQISIVERRDDGGRGNLVGFGDASEVPTGEKSDQRHQTPFTHTHGKGRPDFLAGGDESNCARRNQAGEQKHALQRDGQRQRSLVLAFAARQNHRQRIEKGAEERA